MYTTTRYVFSTKYIQRIPSENHPTLEEKFSERDSENWHRGRALQGERPLIRSWAAPDLGQAVIKTVVGRGRAYTPSYPVHELPKARTSSEAVNDAMPSASKLCIASSFSIRDLSE